MSDPITNKLQVSRNELLDIGLRNNLINYRKTAKNLVIVHGDAQEIFDNLYVSEKSLGFGSTGKAGRKSIVQASEASDEMVASDVELLEEITSVAPQLAEQTSDDDPGRSGARRSAKFRLETALDDERLFLQLLKIKTEAQTCIEEQGVNTLFVALGFLHWYEADSSSEPRKAPLLLIPVNLDRTSALEHFKLVYTGDDLLVNLSLEAKLKTDFGITLPKLDTDAELTADDLTKYFAEVENAVRMQQRWSVARDEIVLGFFSFAKFLMFQDLDPQHWPKEKSPAKHEVLGRLLGGGFGDMEPRYADDVNVDTVVEPGDIHFVKDADSSQTQAILEVRTGSNLVVQGPPGTGKSQTITNVIAELIAQQKTVLFVSEKMAALEVVKRRLDECHLGDAVLELHSQRATKTSVIKELARSLEQGRPLNGKGEQDIKNLKEVQESLNAYCDAVSAHLGNSGLGFLDVLGRYMKLKRLWPTLTPLSFDPLSRWSSEQFSERKELLHELELHLKEMGRPDKNAFWGSERTHFTPMEESTAVDALERSLKLLEELKNDADALSARLMLAQPVTLQDIDVVCRAARRAQGAPKLQGISISTQEWQQRRDALSTLIEAGQAMSDVRARYSDQLIELAWDKDLLSVRQALMTHGAKWWRFLSGEFKSARQQLQALAKGPLPKEVHSMQAMVDAVMDFQQHKRAFDPLAELGQSLFGAQWQGVKSDWEVLRRITDWVVQLHDDLGRGEIPDGIVTFLSGKADPSGLGQAVESIDGTVAKLTTHLGRTNDVLGLQTQTPAKQGDMRTVPLNQLEQQLATWKARITELYPLARFNVLSQTLTKACLGDFVVYASKCESPQELVPLLELTWCAGLVESAYASYPQLRQFDRVQHEHRIRRFRDLDAASLKHAQTQLATKVWEGKPNLNQPGEMAVLRAEINKKRRHLPIRQLILKAGRAMQQIKPVFMMSPMSIANFLPPGQMEFDVVIFDEASQVKAVDAFGAILRGKQVVVVGDTRQMPPTDFFGRDIELDDEDNATGDIESILSLFKAAGCWERYLRWHYRSRHESLIAVSNAEFYDNKLVIFPSSGSNPHASGIRFDHLPETVYDRGRTRTNKGEAKAVAAAVMEHATTTPHLSLGVAAFSVAQRDLIQIEVELLRRRTPEAESFFSRHVNEPFFVKNLENIQGDERDAIFISIGYGRNETGKIAKEFGPLNKDGGHRRLNVLITRAKMAMRVFCNFTADDLELDASAKHGIRALKNFLKYAETKQLEVARETGRATDSPFETEVMEALRDLGYLVEPQVGTAGYFIDMAVKDPDQPGRYLLAVECDGAAYHSSRSARDRDRLRQGVLESLGWRFHRIWSTDWFRNRAQEIKRVAEAIEVARSQADKGESLLVIAAAPAAHVIDRDEAAVKESQLFAKSYVKARLTAIAGHELHQASDGSLAEMIKLVAEVEAPVHVDDVAKRIKDAYGVSRAGSRIAAKIEDALRFAATCHLIERRGDFVYRMNHQVTEVRDRSALEVADRKIELVAPEEIDAALIESVRLGFTLAPDDAATSAIALLGFGRATQRIASVVAQRVDLLIKSGRLVKSGDVLTLKA